MKIMFYSQHVLGIGHFFRSMAIAEALHRHEVFFIEGGDPVAGFIPPPHVHRQLLPSLMMDAGFKVMKAQEGDVEAVKARRSQLVMESFLDLSPDVLVTELFPFGRKQFRFELLPVLQAIRTGGARKCGRTRVVCSLRDILVEKHDTKSYEESVLKMLNSHYDLLLIHSDPQLIALQETFERMSLIEIPVRYTGFVVRRSPRRFAGRDKSKVIVASSGGGNVGADLLEAVIHAVQRLPHNSLELRVFIGPFMDSTDREHLARLALQDARISIRPFSLDFLSELAQADLSISMAGYNTCMDILSTGVAALAYPFPQNREQALRAGKLEAMNVLRTLPDLDAESLSRAIMEALERSGGCSINSLDLSGAEKTALAIEELCS